MVNVKHRPLADLSDIELIIMKSKEFLRFLDDLRPQKGSQDLGVDILAVINGHCEAIRSQTSKIKEQWVNIVVLSSLLTFYFNSHNSLASN
jgi:hypothetical protein